MQCLEPTGFGPRAQAKPGPELCLRSFVGLWEPIQGNAGNWPGCYGVGTPLLPEVQLAMQAWVSGGLGRGPSPLGTKHHPIPGSQSCSDLSGQQIPSRLLRSREDGTQLGGAELELKLTLPSPHALPPRSPEGGSRASLFQSEGQGTSRLLPREAWPSRNGSQDGELRAARLPCEAHAALFFPCWPGSELPERSASWVQARSRVFRAVQPRSLPHIQKASEQRSYGSSPWLSTRLSRALRSSRWCSVTILRARMSARSGSPLPGPT